MNFRLEEADTDEPPAEPEPEQATEAPEGSAGQPPEAQPVAPVWAPRDPRAKGTRNPSGSPRPLQNPQASTRFHWIGTSGVAHNEDSEYTLDGVNL